MKSPQRMSQVRTCFLVIVSVMLVWMQTPTAQLSLSPVTGVQCYGDPVTLVCTHPVLPQKPEFIHADVTWMRDGTAISTVGLGRTNLNTTTTRLQFTITEDTIGNYTCFLSNNVRGGIVESNSVSVQPRDLTPPDVTNMDPLESFITVSWTPQPCDYAVKYIVSWMYTNDDGTTTTGSGVSDQVTSYTIPTSVQGVYTVSVQAVDGVGNVGPATSEVVKSTYPRPTADAPPCEDRSLVLTCQVGGLHNERRSHFMWIDRNSNLTNSTVYTITGDQLMIANVSALSGEDKAIRCCEVLNNGIIVEGVEYNVEPLAQPGPPEVTTTTTDANITLTWSTALHCFESEMFTFVVIWNEIGSGTRSNVTTSSSPYTISGLQPGTSYQISVQGVGGSGVVGGNRVLNVTTRLAETHTEGDVLATAVIIAVVVSVIITLVAVVITIFVVLPRCLKTRVRGDYDMRSSAHDPNPPASINQLGSKLSGTRCYTKVDFESSNPTPFPPPPVEEVAYTEPVAVGEKETNELKTESEFPIKEPHHHHIVDADRDEHGPPAAGQGQFSS